MTPTTPAPSGTTASGGGPPAALDGAVVAVAGAGGPAGHATLLRLARAGATVVAADADAERLAEGVAAARAGGATVVGDTVDLLSPDSARAWAAKTEKEFGRVDGLIHLVGGWRGSASFAETDLADWDVLHDLLIRTVQHTSLAFEAPLARGGNGRYVLVSAAGASRPTAGNAAYAAAKAAAEAWTLALADGFRKTAPGGEPAAGATVLVVKALVTQRMRDQRPGARFEGFTDVTDLADAICGLWTRPTREVNGTRQWLTPQP
ncbi:SDR family NAD(P)-dependent oxidoreductase [Streptomyces sp. SBT349]|uniref:SDR family NAD(P)-dependent oxidoreductase n=1 Tax=Streptomyces sp. SBT349 TaxID=1580539 RepID=UPI00066B70B6|nr:SDR family NAD(P)-dependent oxidoreductase [Streptomyces sp. SBT349]